MTFSNSFKANIAFVACILVSEATLVTGAWATNKNNQTASAILALAAMFLPIGVCAVRCVSMFNRSPDAGSNEHTSINNRGAGEQTHTSYQTV